MKKIITLGVSLFLGFFVIPSFAYQHTLIINIKNNGSNLPNTNHAFTYFLSKITKNVEVTGSTSGTLSSQVGNGVVMEEKSGEKNLEAHLKIIDPDANGRIVWEGNIIYDASENKLKTILYNRDTTHYQIVVDLDQPNVIYTTYFKIRMTLIK